MHDMSVQALWLTGQLGYTLSFQGRPATSVNLTINVPQHATPLWELASFVEVVGSEEVQVGVPAGLLKCPLYHSCI